jgi:hypothetical protein
MGRGNFRRARCSNDPVHPLRLGALPGIRRVRARASAILAEVPILFFAVVIGVALTFRVAVGWARGNGEDPSVLAPAVHAPLPAPTTAIAFAPDPAVSATTKPVVTATAAPPQVIPRAKPPRPPKAAVTGGAPRPKPR